MKTYEELEREAYIHGYIKIADLYDKIIQAEEELSMIDCVEHNESCEVDELIEDVEYWRKRAIEAEGVLESLEK